MTEFGINPFQTAHSFKATFYKMWLFLLGQGRFERGNVEDQQPLSEGHAQRFAGPSHTHGQLKSPTVY